MEFVSFFTGLWVAVTGFLGFGDGMQNEQPVPLPEQINTEEQMQERIPPRAEETSGNEQVVTEAQGDRQPPSPPEGRPSGGISDRPGGIPGGPGGQTTGGPGRTAPGSPGSNAPGGSTPESGSGGPPSGGPGGGGDPSGIVFESGDTQTISSLSIPDSDFFGSYEIDDSTYGTEVEVTVSGNTRTIVGNALPNHETGDFPNSNNPHSINAQSVTYTFPSTGTHNNDPQWIRHPGVAVNSVEFEPTAGEFIECDNGAQYQVEAFNDLFSLGFDENNAHVQAEGVYHYHGYPTELVELYDDGQDLVHLGFAADGNMIYYDTTDTVEPSWQVTNETRSSASCEHRTGDFDLTDVPMGSLVDDWEYVSGSGNLDACNGAYVDGEYAYFITEEYPYIGRCLQGSF